MKINSSTVKIIFTLILISKSLFISNSFAQNTEDWLFTGSFNINYSDKVHVQVGTAAEDKTKKELNAGTKVGKINIDPATYKKMENAAGMHFKLEIKKNGLGNFRDVFLTNIDQKEKIKGLYNIKSRKFIFGAAKNENTDNGKCGKIGIGLIKGDLSADNKAIEKGEFSIGFIAGCNPFLINANAAFYFTGTIISGTIPANTNPPIQNVWNGNVDTTKIKSSLTAGRWEPVFWTRSGITIKAKPTDFADFKTDGSYEGLLLNLPSKGNWKYDASNQTITLALTTGTSIYFISELSDTIIKCNSFNDEFKLRRTAAPKNIEIISAKTVMLCKKWSIASWRNGISMLQPKADDYIQFFSDGKYEQVFSGSSAKGTWKWEQGEINLTVDCNGINTWNVVSINNSEVKLRKGNGDELILK